ncbi:MAG: hypothetical protein RIG62_31860 [Cyclobacteriaceae bacterium]
MEQRDYLKDQIDQLGKVLGMLLARLVGAKPEEDYGQTERLVQQKLNEQLEISFAELVDMPPEALVPRLQQSPAFTSENLEQLAEVLVEMGKQKVDHQEDDSRKYLMQALGIYEYLSDHSRNFSLQWLEKIDALKKELA